MANAVRSYRLHWEIFNPFLPLRTVDTLFTHPTLRLTQWKVVLDPLDRNTNSRNFWFSLRHVQLGEDENDFLAERIVVNISLNGNRVERRDEPNYIFHNGNLNSYSFPLTFNFLPSKEAHRLVVELRLTFQNQNAVTNRGRGFYFRDTDLIMLSWDMRLLFENHFLSDMMLLSNDHPDHPLRVHYWLITARWKNFDRVFNLYASPIDPVQTNISHQLLCCLLVYMYSGVIDWGVNMDEAFMTELFQVIREFDLQHLHTNFFSKYAGEDQSTTTDMVARRYTFPRTGERPYPNPRFYRLDDEVSFQIKFNLDEEGLSFEYALSIESGSRLYARVSVELIRETTTPGRPRNYIREPIHERDYTLRLRVLEQSGTCHFEGNPSLVDAYVQGDQKSGRTQVKYFIRCTLNLSDGLWVHSVQSTGNPQFPDNLERFEVLSNHLEAEKRRPCNALTNVVCRDFPCLETPLHKSMLAARVPFYRTNPEAIPYVIPYNLRLQSFQFILDYIYTGKTFFTAVGFIDDIERFAAEMRFDALRDYVNRMRRDFRPFFAQTHFIRPVQLRGV